MYKKDNIIILVIVTSFITISFIFKINIPKDTINNFITFFTVYLGFIMTAFAIMSSNQEIKKLYLKNDPEDSSIRLLHRLANYFIVNFIFIIFSITILLLSEILFIKLIVSKIILSLFFATLYISKMLLKILYDIFTNKTVL